MKQDIPIIGTLLVKGLTDEQLARLLDELIDKGNLDRCREKFRTADPDMDKMLERVLSIKGSRGQATTATQGVATTKRVTTTKDKKERWTGENRLLASDKKIVERWKELWGEWEEVISEVGDEEGEYVTQDAHWEAPYFDGYSLAEDLEKIGERMLIFLEAAYPLINEPGLFWDALKELNSSIKSYPGWMGPDEGCSLGRAVTRCVLQWFWLSVREEKSPGTLFFNRVYEAEEKFKEVDLDDEAVAGFFSELPEPDCRKIYELLGEEKYESIVSSTYSKWHKIRHLYEARFAPSRYLDTCDKFLSKNWRYGKPLAQSALKERNFERAENLLSKIFSVFLNKKEGDCWYPENSLLLAEENYSHKEDSKEVSLLLEIWSKVAGENKNNKRAAAAQFQGIIYRTPEDWEKVISKYQELLLSGEKKTLESLFFQWGTEITEGCLERRLDKNLAGGTWLHWLLELKAEGKNKSEIFLGKLKAWLTELEENSSLFEKQWFLLALLTKDLAGKTDLHKQYPVFFEVVLRAGVPAIPLDEMLRGELKRLGAGDYLPEIIAIWKNRLGSIVPNPEQAGNSRYEEHSCWMQALYEINPEGYFKHLSFWLTRHKNRRNLWSALKSRQLPLAL